MMNYSENLKLNMPSTFPDKTYTRFRDVAHRLSQRQNSSDGFKEFGGASNAIAWRFRASFEDWQVLRHSLLATANLSHEELYQRERAFFGMLSSGVSSIECSLYAIAALLSHPDVLSEAFVFDERKQLKCDPETMKKWFKVYPETTALVALLAEIEDAPEWERWNKLRNRMSHRSDLPRVIPISATGFVGSPRPHRRVAVPEGAQVSENPSKDMMFAKTSSTSALEVNVDYFDELHLWLSTTVDNLLKESANIADKP